MDDDVVAVVDQRISDLTGTPLGPMAVAFHRYAFGGDLVRRTVAHVDRDAALARREGLRRNPDGRARLPRPPA